MFYISRWNPTVNIKIKYVESKTKHDMFEVLNRVQSGCLFPQVIIIW